MRLTITEAENILSKVFANELGDSKVEIDQPADSPKINSGDLHVSRFTLNKTLKSMANCGLKIDAIKLYREIVPNTGLAEAKHYVETL